MARLSEEALRAMDDVGALRLRETLEAASLCRIVSPERDAGAEANS